ncbi:MAG TPA: DUF6658 family protein [Leptolyngbyaceae cyanobacterium]
MNKVISVFKRFNFLRVLTVVFAGLILFVTTACGSNLQAKALSNNPRPEVPNNAVTNRYEGGMNDFSDVDPRFDASRSQTKANDAIGKAEGNLTKRADSPEQYARNYRSGTPLGERVQNLAEDVSESTKELTTGVAKGTQRGIHNVKENSQDAAEGVADTTERAASNAKKNAEYAGKDLANKADKAGDKVSNFFQD